MSRAPPAVFATTVQKHNFTDEIPLNVSDQAEYDRVRQNYVSRANVSAIDELVRNERAKIEKVLRNGDRDAILEIMRMRHNWREKALEAYSAERAICKVPTCSTIAVIGSSYCTAHIMCDDNQKMFTECLRCKRPFPVTGDCFACRDLHS